MSDTSSQKEYRCKQCLVDFKNSRDLWNHCNRPAPFQFPENPFPCEWCCRSFKTESNLKRHIKKSSCKINRLLDAITGEFIKSPVHKQREEMQRQSDQTKELGESERYPTRSPSPTPYTQYGEEDYDVSQFPPTQHHKRDRGKKDEEDEEDTGIKRVKFNEGVQVLICDNDTTSALEDDPPNIPETQANAPFNGEADSSSSHSEESENRENWDEAVDELAQSQTQKSYNIRSLLSYEAPDSTQSNGSGQSFRNDVVILLEKWRVRHFSDKVPTISKELENHLDSVLLGIDWKEPDDVFTLLSLLELALGFHVVAALLVDYLRLSDFDKCSKLYDLCYEFGVSQEYLSLIKYCFALKYRNCRYFQRGGVHARHLHDDLYEICVEETNDCSYLRLEIRDTITAARGFNFLDDTGNTDVNSLLSTKVCIHEKKAFFTELTNLLMEHFYNTSISLGELLLKCDQTLLSECKESILMTVYNGTFNKYIYIHKSVIERVSEGEFKEISSGRIEAKPKDINVFLLSIYFPTLKIDMIAAASVGLYNLFDAIKVKEIWRILSMENFAFQLYKKPNIIDFMIIAVKTGYEKKACQFTDVAMLWKSHLPVESRNFFLSSLNDKEIYALVTNTFFKYDNELEKYKLLLKWAFLQVKDKDISWDLWSKPRYIPAVNAHFQKVKVALDYNALKKFSETIENHRYFSFNY